MMGQIFEFWILRWPGDVTLIENLKIKIFIVKHFNDKSERSCERAWRKTMEWERSAELELAVRKQSGNYRIRFERGAAFLPLTLRSHALNAIHSALLMVGKRWLWSSKSTRSIFHSAQIYHCIISRTNSCQTSLTNTQNTLQHFQGQGPPCSYICLWTPMMYPYLRENRSPKEVFAELFNL